MKSFKDRLRDEIEYKGLLIKEISAKCGISNSTFLSYVDARGVLPNVETAVKIAQALNVSVEYLVTGENPQEKENSAINSIVNDLKSLPKEQILTVQKMVHALV